MLSAYVLNGQQDHYVVGCRFSCPVTFLPYALILRPINGLQNVLSDIPMLFGKTFAFKQS